FPAFDGSSAAGGAWALPVVCVPNQIPAVVANAAIQPKARCFIVVPSWFRIIPVIYFECSLQRTWTVRERRVARWTTEGFGTPVPRSHAASGWRRRRRTEALASSG